MWAPRLTDLIAPALLTIAVLWALVVFGSAYSLLVPADRVAIGEDAPTSGPPYHPRADPGGRAAIAPRGAE